MRSRAAETFIHKGQQKLAAAFTVIAKRDAREVGHTISDLSQYLSCIMFINLFSASIKL